MTNTDQDNEINEIIELKQAGCPDKHLAYKALRDSGLSIKEASKALDYKGTYGYQLEHKIKKLNIKGNQKLLKSANHALKHLLKGEKFGELKEVKDSTVMSAINAVYDRHDPIVKQSMNLNLNADISPVDLSKYRVGGEG